MNMPVRHVYPTAPQLAVTVFLSYLKARAGEASMLFVMT